ncbi:MAG TPA: thioesterase family protein [Thermohalobaculum sp.]|nr:thioesterase family protein [Thermohalobaculum sp.]
MTARARPQPPGRAAYRAFRLISTRWSDNDVYGHINNVEYYAFFDTVVNAHLIERGVLDIQAGPVIGLVVETTCRYFAPLAFPEPVEGGLRVERLGRSSVTYGVGIFRAGAERAAAAGHFVHVYVDRETRRPVALSAALRAELERLTVGA